MNVYGWDGISQVAFGDGFDKGAAAERASIVAWLQQEARLNLVGSVFASVEDRRLVEACFKMLDLAAQAIERGDHAQPELARREGEG